MNNALTIAGLVLAFVAQKVKGASVVASIAIACLSAACLFLARRKKAFVLKHLPTFIPPGSLGARALSGLVGTLGVALYVLAQTPHVDESFGDGAGMYSNMLGGVILSLFDADDMKPTNDPQNPDVVELGTEDETPSPVKPEA